MNYELCNLLEINITREDTNKNSDTLTISMIYKGNATNGTDYGLDNIITPLPDSFDLLPFQNDTTFQIYIESNDLDNTDENVIIKFKADVVTDWDSIEFIISDDILRVDAGIDSTIMEGETIQLNADTTEGRNIVSIIWEEIPSTNSLDNYTILNPNATPPDTTLYLISIVDEFGCTAVDTIQINVDTIPIIPECKILIPTAFTPDGDGVNDMWNIQCIENELEANIKVYNRWGSLVYESKGGANYQPWDGNSLNNGNLPAGSYYFLIEGLSEETIEKNGIITLIR